MALNMIVSFRITVNVATTNHLMTTGVLPVSVGAGAGAVMVDPSRSEAGLCRIRPDGRGELIGVLPTILG